MTIFGDHGTPAGGTYVPPGTSSTAPKPYPGSPQIPLQTTFPTQLPADVLPSLAAQAGPGQTDGSTMSALLSEDSTEWGFASEASSRDVRSAGDGPTKETPLANGIPVPTAARFVILTLLTFADVILNH